MLVVPAFWVGLIVGVLIGGYLVGGILFLFSCWCYHRDRQRAQVWTEPAGECRKPLFATVNEPD